MYFFSLPCFHLAFSHTQDTQFSMVKIAVCPNLEFHFFLLTSNHKVFILIILSVCTTGSLNLSTADIWGPVLCTVECSGASLASSHWMPIEVTPLFTGTTRSVCRHFQMSLGRSGVGVGKNYTQLRTIAE